MAALDIASHTSYPIKRYPSAAVKQVSVVSLLLLLAATFWIIPSSGENVCACGARRVLLILAEFPEYRHLSSRAEISHLFFGQVGRYFSEISYGKLAIDGNATDWITLPKLYEQYRLSGQQVDLLAVAKDSFSTAAQTFNFTSFDEVFLVLSFYASLSADYIQLPNRIFTSTGSVGAFAVVEEDRDWSAYARAFAMMIGLWRNRTQLPGLGQLDIVSSGQGDMSAWSKISLGWINDTQVLTVTTPPIRRIVILNPIEIAQADTFALRIHLGGGGDEYFIEVRQPVGYDRNNLQDYGVVVLYVPPGNSSIEFRTVLEPDDVGKAIFLDVSADLSVVVLNQTQTGFRLLVGNVRDGRDAQRALYSVSQAVDSIRLAETQNRFDGLDLAQRLAENAHALFTLGRFREAEALALSAETTANSASIPSDYNITVQLINRAEALRNETESLISSQSLALVQLANAQLEAAKQAFVAKNFTLAKQNAQAAIDLFSRAQQINFTERIVGWLSNIALAIPVVILVYAIRYQLKSK